uniref:Thioredoxin domain-containing protein n=1 Tax=Pseudonaja textilis TaxID=8673 RepID=A0A670ZGX5_PSETE
MMSDLEKEFTEFLKSAGPRLVVVNFTAKWCGPCKIVRPFLYVTHLAGMITMKTFVPKKQHEGIPEISGNRIKFEGDFNLKVIFNKCLDDSNSQKQ